MEIYIANKLRQVEITRKKGSRNMYLRVRDDGTLAVSIPWYVPFSEAERFIRTQEAWILRTEKKEEKRKTYVLDGSDMKEAVWLGKHMQLEFIPSSSDFLVVEEDKLIFYLKEVTPEAIRKTFYECGNRQLAAMIDVKREEWDKAICLNNQIPLPKITLKYMTSRWGSCSPQKGAISISSRLIHFPLACLDYVLLHEYAHLLVPNHSKDFYNVITKYMPEYKTYIKMLK